MIRQGPWDGPEKLVTSRLPITDFACTELAGFEMDSPWRTFDLLNGVAVVDNLSKRIGSFSDPNPWHLVSYLSGSHDQICHDDHNSGYYLTQRFGGRLNGYARAKSRLAWALNATLPATPMLFMGTEGHIDVFWNPWVGPATTIVSTGSASETISAPPCSGWSPTSTTFAGTTQPCATPQARSPTPTLLTTSLPSNVGTTPVTSSSSLSTPVTGSGTAPNTP
jgi:hypothetical protein